MQAATCAYQAGVLVALLCAAPAWAQESKSAALAKELVSALDTAKTGSVAAKDASSPDAFVGALYLPKLQLLTIGAVYKAPAILEERLKKKEYREVYVDLNSASERETRAVITDLGSNGLSARPEGDQPADSYEVAGRVIVFDRDWRRQKLSEEEYMKLFAEAEARYSSMLSALIKQLGAP